MKAVVQEFCLLLRQKVNFNKSKLFVSPNCPKQKKRWFNGILRVKCTNKPSKYLGIELRYLKYKKDFFQFLVDKFNQKLAGWKIKLLSQCGRLTLIKSTIASIPSYTFSFFKAPTHVCNKIDQTIRGF